MTLGPKEAVYDRDISPLMTQIIATCKAAGIACHASFLLDDDLACTTNIPVADADDRESADEFREKYDNLARRASRPVVAAFTITSSRPLSPLET